MDDTRKTRESQDTQGIVRSQERASRVDARNPERQESKRQADKRSETAEVVSRATSKKRKSRAYEHFHLKSSIREDHPQKRNKTRWVETYKCNKCGKELKVIEGLGNSNLTRHLRDQHNLNRDGSLYGRNNALDGVVQENMQLQSMEERFKPDTLKTRIVEFFADADIAFSIVEKQSFHGLIGFLNAKAESMLVKQEALKNHATDIYIATRDIVIEKMKKDIRGVDVIHFTTDCWTTKGKNYEFLSLTGHWIDAKFELHQSLLGLRNVEGSHEGKNLEKYYYKMVAENFDLLNVHGHATVDNGSNNSTLFEAFGRRDDVIFDKEDKMHICVAHVLKLVARDGLAQFGKVNDDEDDEVVVERSVMSIGAIVDRPDGADVSIETVYQRIKGFATFVNGSTQRKEQFACAVKLQQPNSHAVAVIGDVSTRWNSTYQMFLRALQLRKSITYMTATMDNFEQYHLDNKEWIKLEQVNRFLEPLEWATKIVCDDKYPTLSVVVPVYSYLWKSVDRIFREYDARHLEPVSRAMHKKLEKYVNKAFKQESNYFATILDPKFNIKWFRDSATWPRHFWTLGYTSEAIELRFGNEATKFQVQVENEDGDDPEFGGSPIADSQPLDPMDRLFSSATEPEEGESIDRLKEEINSYFSLRKGHKHQDPLEWWKVHQFQFPTLARMARYYLAIPATSAPSEQVFSQDRRVFRWDRSALSPENLEKVLCLKEWYRNLGPFRRQSN